MSKSYSVVIAFALFLMLLLSYSVASNLNNSTPVNTLLSSQAISSKDGLVTPRTCTFNGRVILDGSFTIAYQSPNVPSGNKCLSENRTCSAGVLSGSYSYSTCTSISDKPLIMAGGTVSSFQPWAVWLQATNITKALNVRIYDNNGSVWVDSAKITVGSSQKTLSFRLPANVPPSGCNLKTSCKINIQLFNPVKPAIVSNTFSITIPKASKPGSLSSNSIDISRIRSTTYYNYPDVIFKSSSSFLTDLKKDILSIKNNGFNTLWFVVPIEQFYKENGTINELAIKNIKDVLEVVRSNDMKAILPLNYHAGAKAGRFSKPCDILSNSAAYSSYVQKHENFLREIKDYADMAYIVIFTEAVWGCNGKDYTTPVGGERDSILIQKTLGMLPLQLSSDINSRFIFGFHDSYTSRGWNQGTPSMTEGAYNFYSTAFYGKPDATPGEITKEIDKMKARVQSFFPTLPVFQGELGSSWCKDGGTEKTQALVLKNAVTHLLATKTGFNIWQWKPIHVREKDWQSRNCAFGGNSLTLPNGILRQAAEVVRELLK